MDREKVIRAVDACFDYWLAQHKCLYPLELKNVQQLKADAITLLKEPEPIESIDFGDKTEIMANLEGLTWDDWRLYHSDTEVQNIAKSAFDLLIELLKGQEAAEPVSFMDGIVERFACKKCGKHLLMTSWGRDNYCSKCGQKVKWT